MLCSTASVNTKTANKMTSARTVTPGQARARIPTISASTPRNIREVAVDLNIGHGPFSRLGIVKANRKRPGRPNTFTQ